MIQEEYIKGVSKDSLLHVKDTTNPSAILVILAIIVGAYIIYNLLLFIWSNEKIRHLLEIRQMIPEEFRAEEDIDPKGPGRLFSDEPDEKLVKEGPTLNGDIQNAMEKLNNFF